MFPSRQREAHGSNLLRGAQRLPEIVNDIVRSLQTHRETHQFLADAGGGKRRGVHLLMRGARRMDDQRLGVADIGEMTCEPHRFDELRPAARPPLMPKLTIDPAPFGSSFCASA